MRRWLFCTLALCLRAVWLRAVGLRAVGLRAVGLRAVGLLAVGLLAVGLLALPAAAQAAGLVAIDAGGDALEASFEGRQLALLVGVSAYDDDAGFPDLRYASADAHALERVLGQTHPSPHRLAVTLTDPATTTRDAILAALDELLAVAQPQDTLLVYFSGHGTLALDWQARPELYLAPADANRQDLPATALPLRTLQDRLAESRAGRRVLIVDACHHGAGKSSVDNETLALLRGLKSGRGTPLLREPERGYEAHLYASSFGLPALEDEGLGHGVYTHYLIEALTGEELADRDLDGLISVSEAHDHARDRTIEHTGAVQVPRAEYRIVGREQIFLAGDTGDRRQAERALLYTFDDYYEGCRVSVDGQPLGMLPRGLAIEPGPRRVQLYSPAGELLSDERVRLRAGQAIDVERIHRPREAPLLALGGGLLSALAPPVASPVGPPLPGVSLRIGGRLPAVGRPRPVQAELSGVLGGYFGTREVSLGGDVWRARVSALRGHMGLGPRVEAGRLQLAGAIHGGALVLLRPAAAEDPAPASPHLATPLVGLDGRLAIRLGRGWQLGLDLALDLTPGSLAGTTGVLPWGSVQLGLGHQF